ncbi:MAG: hypothetical protein ACX94A_10355 [Algiphilus sp.]
MTPTPILLLGPPGGDIAWAAGTIGGRREMLALPELRLGTAETVGEVLALHARAEDRAGDGLLRTVAQIRFGAQRVDTVAAAEAWLQRRGEWPIPMLLDWLLRHAGRHHLVLHEPHAALRIDDTEHLLRALPDALVVQLVEPVARYCGRIQRDMHGRLFTPPEAQHHVGTYPVLAPTLMWYRVHDTLLRVREDHTEHPWRLLRADLLRHRPQRVLPPLWADIDLTTAGVTADCSPFATPGPANAPLGDDVGYLRAPTEWPDPPDAPPDPAFGHPDLQALAQRLGAPLSQGVVS